MNDTQTVMLVEDDENDQFFFTEALKSIPNTKLFAIAKNGKDALEKMEKADKLPDIIFSDINMPVMDGIECLTELKRKEKIKDIPVIVLSSDIYKAEKVRSLGGSGFITKSNDRDALKEQLKTVLSTDFSHEKIANDIFIML